MIPFFAVKSRFLHFFAQSICTITEKSEDCIDNGAAKWRFCHFTAKKGG